MHEYRGASPFALWHSKEVARGGEIFAPDRHHTAFTLINSVSDSRRMFSGTPFPELFLKMPAPVQKTH
jgi:hypothetical protein